MPAFSDCTVLLAGEQPATTMDLDDSLRRLGCTVLGPVSSAEDGIVLAAQKRPSLALLNLTLWAGGFDLLAEALALMEVPFATVGTAYEHAALPPGLLRRVARLSTPYDMGSLHRLVRDLQVANLQLKIETIDQHIAAGTERLARQVRLAEKLAMAGHETGTAEALAREIGRALRLMRTSRGLFAGRLNELLS